MSKLYAKSFSGNSVILVPRHENKSCVLISLPSEAMCQTPCPPRLLTDGNLPIVGPRKSPTLSVELYANSAALNTPLANP